MDKARRREIDKARMLLREALEIVQCASTDERGAYDNMSERVQDSPKGEAAEGAATALENAECSIEEALGSLDDATGES